MSSAGQDLQDIDGEDAPDPDDDGQDVQELEQVLHGGRLASLGTGRDLRPRQGSSAPDNFKTETIPDGTVPVKSDYEALPLRS